MIFSIWAATAADAQVISAMEILPQAACPALGALKAAATAAMTQINGNNNVRIGVSPGGLP
jgi:metal-sulfur cluster biosynthetic enzyme